MEKSFQLILIDSRGYGDSDKPHMVSFLIGEKDPILKYVSRAQQSKLNSLIQIILQKNHMQLYFDAEITTTVILRAINSAL